MTAADLLPPPPQALPREAALHLMTACVAEYDALKTFEPEMLGGLDNPTKAVRLDRIRAGWQAWAANAKTLLERIKDAHSLNDAEREAFYAKIGRARYFTPIDLKQDRPDLWRRYERTLGGEYVTREEARRALGLSHRR